MEKVNHDYFKFFHQFHELSQKDFDLLMKDFTPRSAKKGELLLKPGEIQKSIFLVLDGIQMSYFDSGNKIHVIAFTYPPSLLAIPESFMFQKPSPNFLQCISDTQLLELSFDRLQGLFNESQQIERLFRKITELILAGILYRHTELHSQSMEQRFISFTKRSPHLLQFVPHKYIASYLNIDPTNFSKLFNSVKI